MHSHFEILTENTVVFPSPEYSPAPPQFPELMTGANGELADVSRRGHPAPGVSITAARQVGQSDPRGEPPFLDQRGRFTASLTSGKPQGKNSRV